MNRELMEKGVHVIISDDISETHRTLSSCDEMHNMKGVKGGMHIIQEVIESDCGLAARIGGFTWHPNDLIEVYPPKKKAQEFHFDIEELYP